ncbi:MAG: methionyl-tRNA synthetase [Alphaproteobacteria bacterium]|jgi:methionyl-tRNA synthetase
MTAPLTDKNRILITSALPYINGIKHLGNLIGSMLPADLYARFQRLRGKEVLYICATDEHGTPAELAALGQNKDIQTYCKEMHDLQRILGEGFLLSWDYFGRTSSPQNHELTQYFQQRLADNDLIYEKTMKQVFSITDNRFLPDRYIEGTCPYCQYDKARGDQCENCTRVLDPTDLINPHSSISGSTNIEIRETKHLFLKQSACVDDLRKWIDDKKRQNWLPLVTSIAEKWLNDGLHDRCITRDLKWGIPVNREGYEDKVFYVWFDAPIGYIAATKEMTDAQNLDDSAWQSWWRHDKGADDVFYIQFMAKDNIPFHTISFPATIFGANDNWKVTDYIKGFNWLTYYGGKFSTSSKRGVFMNHALELYDPDYWRWYLLSNVPEGADAAFTWEHFQSVVNKDLADVLGNFINRTLKFCASKFGDKVPETSFAHTDLEIQTKALILEKATLYFEYLDACEIRKAAQELRSIWVVGNEYLQSAAPWKMIKENPDRAAMNIHFAFNLIHIFGELAKPFIPQAAQTIHNIVPNQDISHIWMCIDCYHFDAIKSGMIFTIPNILFTKIENDDIAKLTIDFDKQNSNIEDNPSS